ncbi:protein NKG7 isoform X2 [Leptonychotes weddellii]|uniref:Protein NKG7 isoform X2 n=1 Tax=Leptonychotes weddellii TaxID=9713 RepID=A0A7F8RDM9_LEPWE|nr:protein NKG7 isoform X2 [Leptonychotes weddellii]
MELCRSLALLTGSLGLVSILIALSTDFWFVAEGPRFSFHSGLWPKEFHTEVPDYLRATQSLSILATLWGLVSVIFLIVSCIPSLSTRGYGPLVSSTMAFAAGRLRAALGLWGPVGSRSGPEPSLSSSSPAIFAVVAMVVYTSERWNQPQHPQIQTFFSWSFYLGWVSAVLLLCAGSLSLGAYCSGPRPGYDAL